MNQDPSFTIENHNQKTFEQILDLIQEEFIDDDSVSIKIEDENTNCGNTIMTVIFKNEGDLNYIDDSTADSAYRKISKVLKENDIEINRAGGGNWSRSYIITRKFIDGKINWRGWLIRPDNFSPENKAILDEISSFPEFIEKINDCHGDFLDKFDLLLRLAFRAGIITEQERNSIEGEKHRAGNV